MAKRKIPVRKHKGVKDPEKQARARFEKVKNKINNPPTEADNNFVPRRVQELKASIERLKIKKPKKKNKKNKDGLIDTSIFDKKEFRLPGMKRREKPVPVFKQMPGEDPRSFMHRITMKCQEVIHESKFEDKFDVEVKRNEVTGQIESVDKLSLEDVKYLKDLTPHNSVKKVNKKAVEKKKERLQKFKDKKLAKKIGDVDEFAKYRDVVQFGEVAHEPPKLTVLPRRGEAVENPGKRDLLLKSLLPSGETKKKISVFDRIITSDLGKVGKKRKNEKSPAEKRRLEAQRISAVQAYRDLKARNQAKNKTA